MFRTRTVLFAILGAVTLNCSTVRSIAAGFAFRHRFIDRHLPGESWAQTALADLDKDGRVDYITGRTRGPIFWYRQETPERWVRHTLGTDSPSDVGGAALDVDEDGWMDVVTGGAWYRNSGQPLAGPFERIVFDRDLTAVHDLVTADVDGDGRLEVLTMSDRNNLRWYRVPRDPRQPWERHDIGPGVHAGIGVGDIDGDADLDVARSNLWYENADGKGTRWLTHENIPFGNPRQPYPLGTHCVALDLDRDGDTDLVMTENEIKAGRIGWLENLDSKGGEWRLHELPKSDTSVRGAYHSLVVADFDNDGDPDVFSCEMEGIPGDKPPRWFIWENRDGKGGQFVEHAILDANLGGHLVLTGDVDQDGDLDLVGKLWRPRKDNANEGRNHVDFLENLHLRRSQAAPAPGPLRIHPENPRYFTAGVKSPNGSLKAVYLTGAHTWNNLVDMGHSEPPEKFDWDAYLSFLQRHHHNFIRLWAWDSTVWDTRANGALGKQRLHHAAPLPWARTGPGNALDGKPKFNLAEFNPEYFDRLRFRVKTAGERGIYVSVMLFEGWGLFHGNRRRGTDDGWAWRNHPFNPANNLQEPKVNGADAVSGQVHTLRNPEVNEFQAAYIRKVVDTLNELDNVLYEVINEGGEKEWNWWVIQTINEHQRKKPKQHPAGNTGHGAERLASMLASPAEWISPGRADGYAEEPPAWSGKKVSLLDTDHIWGVGGNAAWVWKSFLRGHNPIFMDPYDGSVLGKDVGWGAIRSALGHSRRVAERVNLAGMTPRNELASTTYCLADPGREYLVYQPQRGKDFSLELKAGTYHVEWLNPSRGLAVKNEQIEAGDGLRQFELPFEGDAVLYLKAVTE